MENRIEEVFASDITRADFLKRAAATGIGLSLLSGVGAAGALAADTATQTVRWISPRGTLDVMDDFDLWVPVRQGYFSKLGITAKLIGGPIGDALACTKFVAQNQADMGYPSPGVLTASIDSGIAVKSVWDVISGQVFDFALPLNSPIKSPKDLKGKTIALGSTGWQVIVDPMLVELGIDPKSVKYVAAGAQWTQAAATGKADAALAWEGLRHQLAGQGLKLRYLIGTTWSKYPSNVYSARASDLDEVCALLATATRPPEYVHALFTADPAFDPAQIRVARLGGRIVACAKMYPRALRLGTMVVPACGIGNVRTDPQCRHKGLAGALLGECLTAMYLEGALLAPLFAPRPDLFARHGWHSIPERRLEIPAGVLAATSVADKPGDACVRLCAEHDLDAVMALYESVNAARTGSVVRERDGWLRCLAVLNVQGATIFVATHGDEIVGYMAAQPWNTSIDVLEMLLAPRLIAPVGPGHSPAATDVVLSLLRAALAHNRDAAVVRAGLPADYRRLVGDALTPHVATAGCADLMLRMVDPLPLLQQLAPVLSARLRAGLSADLRREGSCGPAV